MPRTSPTARATLGVAVAGALLLSAASTASATVTHAPAAAVPVSAPAAAVAAYTPSPADQRIASKLTARVTTTRFGTCVHRRRPRRRVQRHGVAQER